VGGLGSLLTSYRRRQYEAQDAMALVERMATDITHHLDGVLAITARLEHQPLTPDASAFVRAIGETSRDMGLMLGRGIDLHRSTLGQLPMDPAPVRLRDLADAVEARWSARAADVGSTLLFSYSGDPECGVEVDGLRLLQVFDALIESALASGRGVIEACLQARPDPDGVHLDGSVRDNAPSPAQDRLDRVLKPLGATRSEDRTEMALGVSMALAHRIMRDLSGVVTAEANRGAGLTVRFGFTAPCAIVDVAAPAEPTIDARAAHILIVDDNATNRMVAEALCDMFDCTSEQAVDGVEAVEMARSGRFDLILMDIKMPRMDGITASRAIREMPGALSTTPIVALTANADPTDVQTYLAAGMQDVVEKPIKPERLALVLNALLSDTKAEVAA
jgi:CheY-like chemotaxis protein